MGAEGGIAPRQQAYETNRGTSTPSTANGTPDEIWTRISRLKIYYPKPLDDGGKMVQEVVVETTRIIWLRVRCPSTVASLA